MPSVSQLRDLSGECFGRLTVLARAENHKSHRMWKCHCQCGTLSVVRGSHLRRGTVLSCGCLRVDCGKATVRHGHSYGSLTYESWQAMMHRCSCPTFRWYHLYGGRGIRVCERWKVFENFLADMGERPSSEHSIDRYPNNDGNYEPGNCRWATQTEQRRNNRFNRMLTYQNETFCVSEWAERLGKNEGTLHSRLRQGWDDEKVLSTPIRAYGNSARRSKP